MASVSLNRFQRLQPRRQLQRHVCRAARSISVTPREIYDCYVYGGEQPIKGICHFIGGAFGGAIPQVIYPIFLRDLAENGYTVIATPFPVTFKHQQCAEALEKKFSTALEELRRSQFAEKVPLDVPLHGIGHSFGALAHALISSSGNRSDAFQTNVLISFNNKAVEDAIPIPGFLNAVTTAFRTYDQLPLRVVPDPIPIAKELGKRLIGGLPPTGGLSRRTVDDALDQVDSIFREIRDGVTDFDPPPSISAQRIATGYSIPNTLLLQFNDDGIDETNILDDLMKRSPMQRTENRTIPGTHLTPCVADIRWLRDVFDVVVDNEDAERLFQDNVVLNTQSLIKTVVKWLDEHGVC